MPLRNVHDQNCICARATSRFDGTLFDVILAVWIEENRNVGDEEKEQVIHSIDATLVSSPAWTPPTTTVQFQFHPCDVLQEATAVTRLRGTSPPVRPAGHYYDTATQNCSVDIKVITHSPFLQANMKVVRVVEYHKDLKLEEAPEPKIDGPLDVIVKIGAVCQSFRVRIATYD